MTTDFLDAHKRHWEGAELLYENSHWANADHLYGLSAECGVKALMCAFGMTLDAFERPPSQDARHIDKLEPRYEVYRAGKYPAKYAISFAAFTNWHASQRYMHRTGFTEMDVELHRKATHAIHNTVIAAKLDGAI